jgi:phage tail protein X
MAKVIRSLQGDTVDMIASRCYDGDTSMVTSIMSANPGLAGKGIILPKGTLVTLPERTTTTTTATTSLWD